MKTQFKILILMFSTSTLFYAQNSPAFQMDEKHTIYKENFKTNENTTFVLNLKNTSAQIFESPDDKVYIEYTKEFNNTRKKRIKNQLKHLIVLGKKEGNKITYSAKIRNDMHYNLYDFEEFILKRSEKEKYLKGSTTKVVLRKSLDSILHDIKASESIYRNRFISALNRKTSYPRYKKNNQFTITKMIIKIPKNIHVRATLEGSNLVFFDDFFNRSTMNARNSKLKFKTLSNPLNIFDVDNGYFRATEVANGIYSFANVKQVIIGELENAQITSEFTKLEIGEIGRGNKIIDFNSKYYLYNFRNDFGDFNMYTEYSDINLFYPKNIKFYLETIGYNTLHKNKSITTEITESCKNESSKMIVIGKESNPNKIKINTIHGIIRFGEGFIDLGE
ncbi:hypothetical protein [Lacinutrix jangbogonensis]|uniref:hypothetical protein n=1 Tax=Lacinutrix jangbogonensis TaxID=1469557 RepID=UPI00053D5396|nr:hypothetical protein [Lacinutrix jangbogonensis]